MPVRFAPKLLVFETGFQGFRGLQDFAGENPVNPANPVNPVSIQRILGANRIGRVGSMLIRLRDKNGGHPERSVGVGKWWADAE